MLLVYAGVYVCAGTVYAGVYVCAGMCACSCVCMQAHMDAGICGLTGVYMHV